MTAIAIVSYDDTLNDQDALALGRLLQRAGARLILAYVHHPIGGREKKAETRQHEDAVALLARGARWLGDLEVERRTVVHASTSQGLRALAEETGAELIVFGSDYRTAAGLVSPQRSTQALLESGPAAVAIAPAAFRARRDHRVARIGLLAGLDDHASIDTAHSLARAFAAEVTDSVHGVDLLLVGSRPEAAEGRVLVSAAAQNAIEEADAPVIVVARDVPLRFEAPLYAA
jgi:nucleotide-binding universal stress UspA family protein